MAAPGIAAECLTMTPERWEQVGRLYEAAAALTGNERAAFLRDICGDDSALRQEVESLLQSDAAAGEYLNAGALDDAARMLAESGPHSLVGTTFSHYTVLSLLGAGGMGEVYRARDSRLGREVAIKTISGLVMPDEEIRRRFESEARTVAALSHPNVRALYDVGEVHGRLYAVMELLEGETLRGRLGRGPLPVRKAVEIATAIADGMAAAHSKGIVHRDLKPENVFITAAGQVKVLDFGIAKTQRPLERDRQEYAVSSGLPDVVLGTPGYISPEQLSGADVDARSDIFSFGCVLYEMVSGRRAFDRGTPQETMTAIAEEEPAELDAVRPDLARVIARCLERAPAARFQSAQDLAFSLRALPESTSDTAVTDTVRGRRGRRGLWLAAAAAAAVAVVVAALTSRRPAPAASIHSYLLPPADAEFCADCGIALSPDGRRLAFVARQNATSARGLWVQSLSDSSARLLAGTDGARFPFWSPDNKAVGFFAGETLNRIDVADGVPQRLCSPCTGQATWGEQGIIVFGGYRNPLRAVSASGGDPYPITELDPTEADAGHMHPVFLPGGRRVLFRTGSNRNPQRRGIYVASLDSKPMTLITVVAGIHTPQSKIFVAGGHLLFVQQSTLMAVPFDAVRARVEGVPEPIAQTAGPFAVAGANLVYARPQRSQFAWLDRDGRELEALPIHGDFFAPKLSHDGRRVAVSKMAEGAAAAGDIWVYDLTDGHGTRLTTDPAHDMLPLWSPDDEWIIFSSERRGQWELFRKRSNGVGPEEVISFPGFYGQARSWSRGGESLIANDDARTSDVWQLSLPRGRATVLFKTLFREWSGEISPDGRYVAYVSDETGQPQTYVQPLPTSGERWMVSRTGGQWPKWRADSRELFFVDVSGRQILAADVQPGPPFVASPPRPLFATTMVEDRAAMFDVIADGQRFLVTKAAPDAQTGRITLVQNWTATLKR